MIVDSKVVRTLYYFALVRPECLESCYEYYINNKPMWSFINKVKYGRNVVHGCICKAKVSRKHLKELLITLYENRKLLMEFMENVEYGRGGRCRCPYCGKGFANKRILARHICMLHLEKLQEILTLKHG